MMDSVTLTETLPKEEGSAAQTNNPNYNHVKILLVVKISNHTVKITLLKHQSYFSTISTRTYLHEGT